MTTTALLVAAIRDALLKNVEASEARDALADRLERVLYHDKKALNAYKSSGDRRNVLTKEGEDVEFCRLVPSYSDRAAFFNCILEGLRSCERTDYEENGVVSFQTQTKRYFDQEVQRYLAKRYEGCSR